MKSYPYVRPIDRLHIDQSKRGCVSNLDHARKADKFLKDYSGVAYPDDKTTITDLLTDLLHLCRMRGLDIDSMIELARHQHDAEYVGESQG